jgi:hypothetical protein
MTKAQLGRTGLEISGRVTGAMTRERIANLPVDDGRRRDARFPEPHLSEHLAPVERIKGWQTVTA